MIDLNKNLSSLMYSTIDKFNELYDKSELSVIFSNLCKNKNAFDKIIKIRKKQMMYVVLYRKLEPNIPGHIAILAKLIQGFNTLKNKKKSKRIL